MDCGLVGWSNPIQSEGGNDCLLRCLSVSCLPCCCPHGPMWHTYVCTYIHNVCECGLGDVHNTLLLTWLTNYLTNYLVDRWVVISGWCGVMGPRVQWRRATYTTYLSGQVWYYCVGHVTCRWMQIRDCSGWLVGLSLRGGVKVSSESDYVVWSAV